MDSKNEVSVLHFAHWGGSGITSLIKDFVEMGNASVVILKPYERFYVDFSQAVDKVQVNFSLRRSLTCLLTILFFYKRVNPKIVHAHSLVPLLISALFFYRSKLVFHIHNEYPYFEGRSLRHLLKRLALRVVFKIRTISVVSVSTKGGELVKHITKSNYTLILNGIEDSGSSRAPFLLKPDQFRFFSMCRLEQSKNLVYAIRLIAELKAISGLDVQYSIYGEGPQKDQLTDLVNSLGAGGFIFFEGFTNTPDEVNCGFDYYISTSFHEGFGLSILNAFRGGNLVFMSQTGELVNHAEDGFHCFYLRGNLDLDVERVGRVMRLDVKEKTAIQDNAKILFKSRFRKKQMTNNLRIYYEHLI